MPRLLVASLLLSTVALLGADPKKPALAEAIPIDSDWKARADAWFTTTGDKARQKEMRKQTKALRKPCKHCHTRDWEGYTDRLDISRQMMALSAEHGVPCGDCHAGKKDKLTELGTKTKPWWKLSMEKKGFCEHCHVPAKRFEVRTAAGKKYAAEAKKKAKAKGKTKKKEKKKKKK